MPKMNPLVVAMSLAILVASQPLSAQVGDPTQTRSATRVIQPPPPPPPLRQVEPISLPSPVPMRTDLGQRDQAPAVSAPVQKQAQQQDDDARRIGAPAAKVYDRNGRELSGMELAGANRVLDTRTGKYYDTVPMGDGQRIKP